ncbi:hypothetical protein [Steroidobacter cummioxidans]|uniref:hypothetical protein n=1 Tax=Steroidobacter cummioxidans TaxID=1803913 RepID=UPI0012900000|nr:hypothetical protein [Steroidobacter cummioxidans]
MRVKKMGLFVALAWLSSVPVSNAGPYSDDLSKCLVSSTTPSDKGTLVKWVFAMAALHPEVKGTSALTAEQRTELSKNTAALFTDLIAKRCKDKAQEAVKYEGPSTLEASFSVLGQAAMMELFSNSDVAAGLAELGKFLDTPELEAAFGPTESN